MDPNGIRCVALTIVDGYHKQTRADLVATSVQAVDFFIKSLEMAKFWQAKAIKHNLSAHSIYTHM